MATAKIATKTETKIMELLNENNKLKIMTVIKLANRANKIDCDSFLCALIKVKKQIDRAIKTMTSAVKTPKPPTVAASSNISPDGLSKRTFHKGEALKSAPLYFTKS